MPENVNRLTHTNQLLDLFCIEYFHEDVGFLVIENVNKTMNFVIHEQ